MIKMSEYAKRRKSLMQRVGAKGIVILYAAPEILRNADTLFPYRQNSDFYYLTGFNEPDAVMVLAPKRKAGEYILFNRVRDRDREVWDGPRAGQEGARKEYQADQSFPIENFEKMLPELLADRETIHHQFGADAECDEVIFSAVNELRGKIRGGLQAPITLVDVMPTIHEARLFKSSAEIDSMSRAAEITAEAHIAAMRACEPGMYEYELEAELTYAFQRNGARFAAYPSIVGAGRNSCILHYVTNNQQVRNGDLVLIDAGAEVDNYASDVTRTFPANGKFNAEQKAIYELVLASQIAGIKAVKPGAPWNSIQNAILKVLTQGLIDLKILKGRCDDLIAKEAYMPFYMHKSGHWLGLDVHDVGRYKLGDKWRTLEAGQVLTVEPGLYISADTPGVDKRWHNIGVRIEDDVVVTKQGPHVMTAQIPKTVEDVEATMAV
jgi:Xaa-Pro aminopeptidase